MGQKVAGTVYVKVDGQQLVITGGVECPIGDVVRETIEGAPGYFTERDRVPYVKVEALHTADFPVDVIANGTDMTVQAEYRNGKTYVLTGAYMVGETTSTGDDGKVTLEFNGVKGIWQ
ncbi:MULTISPECIES: phage tail tube protein [Alcaligenes]|uniref:phage tail tube protein n=1 Tax=Alcaligenes TaxID=507 RepID=UPI00075ECAD2|nr:phage tail tube protein [Alcaligenes faecalis]KVX06451.1 phage tail protein [Alcaligenes faecalis]MCR4146656.1 phage tail tube protein [Alcaligenes faecalis]ULH05336.1 phage tail tube protein [Alcaligenes faecalis]